MFFDGVVSSIWDNGIMAFDENINYQACVNNGGAGCPSLDWGIVTDVERAPVLEVSYASDAALAGIAFQTSGVYDLSAFICGSVSFNIKVTNAGSNGGLVMKVDCLFPCISGEQPLGDEGTNGWQSVKIPVADLMAEPEVLELTNVNTGLVIYPSFGHTANVIYQLDNVRWIR